MIALHKEWWSYKISCIQSQISAISTGTPNNLSPPANTVKAGKERTVSNPFLLLLALRPWDRGQSPKLPSGFANQVYDSTPVDNL
jgi:hypothetical protein